MLELKRQPPSSNTSKFGCLCGCAGRNWWTRRRNDKYETQCNNPEKSRCRAYLSTKVLVCAQVQSTHKVVNPPNRLSGMPAHPSPAAPSDQSVAVTPRCTGVADGRLRLAGAEVWFKVKSYYSNSSIYTFS